MSDRQSEFAASVDECISPARFAPFLAACSGDRRGAYELYLHNIALCEAFYPLLNITETAVRNRLDRVLRLHFGVEDWLLHPPKEVGDVLRRRIQETAARLRKEKPKAPCTHDMLVAASTFGLWVELHSNSYEHLWHKILRQVYPHLDQNIKRRKPVAERVERIRRFRNRVFHHEPIWNQPDLSGTREALVDLLGWIEPGLVDLAARLDRTQRFLISRSTP